MDAVLSELIADLSRSHIQGLFDIGAVSILPKIGRASCRERV